MDRRQESLLHNAQLHISDFDIHVRREMKTMNRTEPCYIVSYHKKGEAKLRIGNEIYDIKPGSVIYIPPHVEHDHYKTSTDETVFLWWHFTYKIAGVFDALQMFPIPYVFQLNNTDEFERIFHQTKEALHVGKPLNSILKQAKALELLYILLDNAILENRMNPDAASDNFAKLLAQIIEQPERSLSLKQLSKDLHMHPTYISNRFKELYGKTPIQAHKEIRIHKAKTLLETSQMSVTEIARQTGFSEVPSFTRLFKSHAGCSPLQYRTLVKKKDSSGSWSEKGEQII
jgi:AraC family transcriptional regulator of arabinose operon